MSSLASIPQSLKFVRILYYRKPGLLESWIQYVNGPPLYFVRGGSATVLSEAEMHSVQKVLYNFESGRDAEVDARGKIIFGAVYRYTPGKDFLPSSEICARTIYNFESGFRFDKEPM